MIKTGIDISSKRIGPIEKSSIIEILKLPKNAVVLDLGSGKSFFSIITSFLGKNIFAIDKNFENNTFLKLKILKKIFNLNNFNIVKKNISEMKLNDFPKNIALVYSGRFLHYLKYKDADNLLKILKRNMKKGGKIFFSVSGIESDLAKNYKGLNVEIVKRFFLIEDSLKERFKIKEKICLYSESEAEELFSKYFKIEKIKKTDFGNINIIASKI